MFSMTRLRSLIGGLLLSLILFTTLVSPTFASDIRTGEKIHLSKSEQFENLYSFGQEVTIDSRVKGDIVAAGRDLTITGTSSGSVLGAGGNISISGNVGNSARIAGGDIRITGPIQHDVVVFGGTLTIEKTASVGGDVIFAGGTLNIDGPVRGRVLMSAGNVIIKSLVGGSVQGNAGTLMLQNGAEVKGDLNYTSSQRALISDGAIVRGQDIYHASERKNGQEAVFQGLLYKLVTDILITLLLVMLFPGIISRLIGDVKKAPLKKGSIGLAFLLLTPVIALFALLTFWLGISLFLLYFLFLILSLFLAKIILGYYLLNWWNTRNKGKYKLDWKAAVLGSIVMALILLVPIIGWLAAAVIYLITLGSLVLSSLHLRAVKAGSK